MLMVRDRRPSWRTVERWAIRLLLEEGAIKQCPDHGYMQCRGDPDASTRAFQLAREDLLVGLTPEDAVAALVEVLDGIGDACPEC
jgi:hypothetical protein